MFLIVYPFKTYLSTLSCGQERKSRNLLRWDAIAVTQHVSENKRFAQICCGRGVKQFTCHDTNGYFTFSRGFEYISISVGVWTF